MINVLGGPNLPWAAAAAAAEEEEERKIEGLQERKIALFYCY